MAIYTNCFTFNYNSGHAFLGTGNSGVREYITITNPLGVTATVNSISMKFGTGNGTFTQYGSAVGYGNPISVALVGWDDGVSYGTIYTSTVVYPNSSGYPDYGNLGDDVYTFSLGNIQLGPSASKTFTFTWDDSWGNALIWSANADAGSYYNGYAQADITPATVSITYKSNYSGGPADHTQSGISIGATVQLWNGSDWSRPNYTLAHWNTAYDDSGVTYATTDSIMVYSNLTLYAIWELSTATVTYYKNDGTSDNISEQASLGSYTLKNASTFTRSGYKLIGWNTAANGSGTGYLPSATIQLTGALTLYAVWYENFKWTDNDSTNIIAGKPTTNATADTFNYDYQMKLRHFVDSTYTPTIVSSGGIMAASTVNSIHNILSNVPTVTSGNIISATTFSSDNNLIYTLKSELNAKAKYIFATPTTWDDVIFQIQCDIFNQPIGFTMSITDIYDTHDMVLIGKNKDTLYGGGTATTTWLCVPMLNRMPMNSTATTVGGWDASSLRTHLRQVILPSLPDVVKNNIKTVSKVTKNFASGSFSDVTSYETIFLLSSREVNVTWPYLESSGCIYDEAFPDDASRIKYLSGNTNVWWLRTSSGGETFKGIASTGAMDSYAASSTNGIVYGFCL